MDTKEQTKQHIVTLFDAKHLVDDYLLSVFKKRRAQAGQVSEFYEALWQEIENLYASGGKRLRPYIAMMTYQSYGKDTVSDILPVAASLELIHQAMLVHDDIIDRDVIRYGVKNITGQYNERYKEFLPDSAERRHFAESSALLAGDLLISEAHSQIALSGLDAHQIVTAQQVLSNAIFHVAGGELIDTEASFRPAGSVDPLTIAMQKTASYSFISPLIMGASLAGADEEQIAMLTEIGNTVGVAFQLRDDIIGVFGDEAVTGKSADNDLREGKRTLLINEFYMRASDDQQREFETFFGNQDAAASDLQRLRTLLEETGTKSAVEGIIANYQAETTTQLARLDISDQARSMFAELIGLCLVRQK